MTDYDEINARKLAERRPPDPNQHLREHEPMTRSNLDRAEQLATELHQRWMDRDFPGGLCLEVGGTEKLALLIKRSTGGLDDSDCDFSSEYVMIDGRLVHYKVTNKVHPEFALARKIKDWRDIRFCTYRQYVEEELANGHDMFGHTQLTIDRLTFTMGRL